MVEQLERVQPDAPINAQLDALALKAQGQNDQAVKLLTTYAGRHPEQLVSAARVLEQMGYVEEAEKLLRSYAAQNRVTKPVSDLVLALFLSRHDRIHEALDLCEPLWKSAAVPVGQVANACATILLGKNEPEQARRVETWLNEALANKPEDLELLTSLAVLRTIQGDTNEAERIYRQVLDRGSESGPAMVAMNNLAWLLAFESGKTDEALSLINRALGPLGGKQPAMLDTRAVIQLARGDLKSAIRDLELALSQEPEPAMYFHLARAQLANGQIEAAKIAWNNGLLMGLEPKTIDPLERSFFDDVKRKVASAP